MDTCMTSNHAPENRLVASTTVIHLIEGAGGTNTWVVYYYTPRNQQRRVELLIDHLEVASWKTDRHLDTVWISSLLCGFGHLAKSMGLISLQLHLRLVYQILYYKYTDDPTTVPYSCAISGGDANRNGVWVDPVGTYNKSIQESVRPFRAQAIANPGVKPPLSSGSRPSNPGSGTPTNTGDPVVQFGCSSMGQSRAVLS